MRQPFCYTLILLAWAFAILGHFAVAFSGRFESFFEAVFDGQNYLTWHSREIPEATRFLCGSSQVAGQCQDAKIKRTKV